MTTKRNLYRAWADTGSDAFYQISDGANFASIKAAEDAARREVVPGSIVYIVRLETIPYEVNGVRNEWIAEQAVVKEFKI